MKLRKDEKELLLRKARNNAISKRLEELQNIQRGIATEAAEEWMREKGITNWVESIPKCLESFPTTHLACFYYDGKNLYSNYDVVSRYTLGKPETPSKAYKMCVELSVSKDIPIINYEKLYFELLYNPFIDIHKNLNDLWDAEVKLVKTINAALQSCNTRKQLQDNYPKLYDLLPEREKKLPIAHVSNEKLEACLNLKC